MIRTSQIQELVAGEFRISVKDLIHGGRRRVFVRPRHIAMKISSALTNRSLSDIGRSFDVDHTSVIHAINAVDNLNKNNADFRHEYQQILEMCRTQSSPVFFRHRTLAPGFRSRRAGGSE